MHARMHSHTHTHTRTHTHTHTHTHMHTPTHTHYRPHMSSFLYTDLQKYILEGKFQICMGCTDLVLLLLFCNKNKYACALQVITLYQAFGYFSFFTVSMPNRATTSLPHSSQAWQRLAQCWLLPRSAALAARSGISGRF